MFRRLGATAVILAVAAACGDSTGPEDFSPTTTQQKAGAVLGAFDNNVALQTLRVLGSSIDFGGAASLGLATLPAEPADLGAPATAARLRTLAPSFGASASFAIFPADLLGKTFVYNPQTSRYEQDPNRTGAPSNGVRVILYAVDPILEQVVIPLVEIGYLDLTDESTPSTDAVRLVAVINTVTYLDYTASATRTTTSLTLSAVGYVSNGTRRVDFDLSFTLAQSSITIDYELTSTEGSIRLAGTLSGEDQFTATLTIDDGDNTVALELTVTPSTISGEITYNGDVAVVISGTPDEPVFTRPDGTPLTEAEIEALREIGDLIERIFDHFDDLLGPALLVFLLA